MRKIIAVLLALLLTGVLILFSVSFLGRQVLLPAMSDEGAPVSSAVLREEERLIRERVTALSELYGFQAEPVISMIDEETLRDLNIQASRWWSSVVKNGQAGEEIRWNPEELEKTIAANPDAAFSGNGEDPEYLAVSGAEAVKNSVIRTVLPMRQPIMELGLQKVGEKADLPNLVSFFLGIPWAALALCLLLAGLTVLAGSRTIRGSLHYLGGAFGAAALVLIAVMVLFLKTGIQPMIREASESLAFMYQETASHTLLVGGILAAGLIIGSILCLAMSREKEQKV